MFIEQAFKAKNDFWRYLIGSLIIGGAAIAGQFIVVFAIIFKLFSEGKSLNDFATIDESNFMTMLDSNLMLFLLLLSFVFALIAIIMVLKGFHSQKLIAITTARKKVDWKRILFAFFFWGIVSSSLVLIDYY
ncbi:MAG: CPBP family intramembrane glutamate endopeptidase, partial [Bacteroidota bacterium]